MALLIVRFLSYRSPLENAEQATEEVRVRFVVRLLKRSARIAAQRMKASDTIFCCPVYQGHFSRSQRHTCCWCYLCRVDFQSALSPYRVPRISGDSHSCIWVRLPTHHSTPPRLAQAARGFAYGFASGLRRTSANAPLVLMAKPCRPSGSGRGSPGVLFDGA